MTRSSEREKSDEDKFFGSSGDVGGVPGDAARSPGGLGKWCWSENAGPEWLSTRRAIHARQPDRISDSRQRQDQGPDVPDSGRSAGSAKSDRARNEDGQHAY